MRKHIAVIAFFSLIFSSYVYADPLSDILTILGTIQQYQQEIQQDENTIQGYEQNIQSYTKEAQQDMSGNYGWGTSNFQDFQSWGTGATSWNSVLSVAQNGGNGSALGQVVQGIQSGTEKIPFNTNLLNQVDSNQNDQNYYAMQAQTALASRAASEVDFNNIQNQINYENTLRKNIEQTTNVKAAMDLQNRLAAENNLIQLEILRQIALMNQQKSVSAQEDINNATQNASFLQKN